MTKEPPPITCMRCGENVDAESRIETEKETVCRSCSTEREIEEWQEYVDEMEARASAEKERQGGLF